MITDLKKPPVYLTLIAVLFLGMAAVRPLYRWAHFTNRLKTIPKEERESLEWFFRGFQQPSAYVLFGTKPMGFLCIQREEFSKPHIRDVYNFMDSICKYYIGNFIELKGWETWKKHKHLFPSSNFLLFENSDPSLVTVFIINKPMFLKTVEENLDLFKAVLGPHVTPQKVLDDCSHSNDLIKGTLKWNDALLGTLLGFGRHNAELFWRRTQIENDPPLSLKPSDDFSTLEQELEYLNAKLQSFHDQKGDDCNQLALSLPGFAVDLNHPETQKLKMEYSQQQEKIVKKYKDQDFLEVTLRQFCQG